MSNRSAGIISGRFPGDIFTKICSFIDIYRAGSLTPGITLILFTQAIAQLKDIYRGLIAPVTINPGLLQDVFTGTLWSTRILSQPENIQDTLLISSRFPGVLDNLYIHLRAHGQRKGDEHPVYATAKEYGIIYLHHNIHNLTVIYYVSWCTHRCCLVQSDVFTASSAAVAVYRPSLTTPLSVSRMLPALTSRWIRLRPCRYSRPCRASVQMTPISSSCSGFLCTVSPFPTNKLIDSTTFLKCDW